MGLDSLSKNSPGVSTSELLKLELVLRTAWVQSSESMCGELDVKLGRREEVKSDILIRESWRLRLDG